jgi:tetratricopeptide (TPR) repeat protein
MKEIFPGKRMSLYGGGAALCGLLFVAGILYTPSQVESLKDQESSLAIHMTMGDVPSAKEDIKKILKRDPGNLYALLMHAYILASSGETLKALGIYKGALHQVHKCPELEDDLLETISHFALKTGHYEEARQYAERNIRVFGENVTSRLIISLSSFLLRDDKSFEENMDRAMGMDAFDPAFKKKLAFLIEDNEKLHSLYHRAHALRARYERMPENLLWK